jgi:hypothetical protein
MHFRKKVKMLRKIFVICREKLSEETRKKADKLLDMYPSLKGFTRLRRR